MAPKRISIKVIPRSKHAAVEIDSTGTAVTIRVKSTPTDGKANEEVIRLLATFFRIPKLHITIISGHTSRHKIIQIVS